MSKIKEFENIPDIDIEGEETLEEAVADCKALFGKNFSTVRYRWNGVLKHGLSF